MGRYFEFLGHKFLGTAVAVQLLGLRFGVASSRGKSGHCLIWTLASKKKQTVHPYTCGHMRKLCAHVLNISGGFVLCKYYQIYLACACPSHEYRCLHPLDILVPASCAMTCTETRIHHAYLTSSLTMCVMCVWVLASFSRAFFPRCMFCLRSICPSVCRRIKLKQVCSHVTCLAGSKQRNLMNECIGFRWF